MARSSTQALLQLLIYSQRATRGVALVTARQAVADGLGGVTADFQRLSRSVDERLSAVVDPRTLIDDRAEDDERTWSAARILQELAVLRALIAEGGVIARPTIPAGVGGGLLLALPLTHALPIGAAPPVADVPPIPAGIGSGLLLALPLARTATI